MSDTSCDSDVSREEQTPQTSVSVVISLYNKEEVILRALDSVYEQVKKNDEVIVIDDGSSDMGALKAEKRFGERAGFRLISQKNQGAAVARNTGASCAKNEHVVFLDADDWWLPGMRDKIDGLVNRWPEAIAWSVSHYRVDGNRCVEIKSGLLSDELLSGVDFIRLYGKFSGLINASSVCMKKSFLLRVGGFPAGATSGEDIYVWLRLGLLGPIAVTPEPMVAIERSMSFDEVEKGRDPVGYHYQYFCDEGNLRDLSIVQRREIKIFMMRNGARQVGSSLAAGKRAEAWARIEVLGEITSLFWFIALPFMLLPRTWFVWAFRKRHGLSNDQS